MENTNLKAWSCIVETHTREQSSNWKAKIWIDVDKYTLSRDIRHKHVLFWTGASNSWSKMKSDWLINQEPRRNYYGNYEEYYESFRSSMRLYCAPIIIEVHYNIGLRINIFLYIFFFCRKWNKCFGAIIANSWIAYKTASHLKYIIREK